MAQEQASSQADFSMFMSSLKVNVLFQKISIPLPRKVF